MQVTVTGATGFLGRHVTSAFLASNHEVISLSSKTDLRDADVAYDCLAGADVVVHLAARVGGIFANATRPAEFFLENLLMGVNVVNACHELKIPRLVMCGTVCSYPKFTKSPFKEESLWDGFPEETNAPYGVSKKAIYEMCRAFHKQYGMNYITLLPTNMFGRHDNYSAMNSHIIPDTIRKIDGALKTNRSPLFWGTGNATREFLNVKDAARAFVMAAESDFVGGPINLGSGQCFSIRQTIETVAKIMGYKGPLEWDRSKPDGQPHRFLDCTKAKEILGFEAQIPFEDGLREAIEDYRERYGDS